MSDIYKRLDQFLTLVFYGALENVLLTLTFRYAYLAVVGTSWLSIGLHSTTIRIQGIIFLWVEGQRAGGIS